MSGSGYWYSDIRRVVPVTVQGPEYGRHGGTTWDSWTDDRTNGHGLPPKNTERPIPVGRVMGLFAPGIRDGGTRKNGRNLKDTGLNKGRRTPVPDGDRTGWDSGRGHRSPDVGVEETGPDWIRTPSLLGGKVQTGRNSWEESGCMGHLKRNAEVSTRVVSNQKCNLKGIGLLTHQTKDWPGSDYVTLICNLGLRVYSCGYNYLIRNTSGTSVDDNCWVYVTDTFLEMFTALERVGPS